MKLLADSTLQSYVTPAAFSGFIAAKHDINFSPTFDTFDQVNPDIYIADADKLTEAVFKNIEERPALKVFIVQKTGLDTEHPNKQKVLDRFGNIFTWILDGGHADLLLYNNAQFHNRYKADIITIQDNESPLLKDIIFPDDIIFRIFSINIINHNNYCGFAVESIRKNLYKSSRLSFSTGDHYYNSIVCDCMPIPMDSNYLESLNTDYSTALKELKELTLNKHTNFHAITSILDMAGYIQESKIIQNKLKEIL